MGGHHAGGRADPEVELESTTKPSFFLDRKEKETGVNKTLSDKT